MSKTRITLTCEWQRQKDKRQVLYVADRKLGFVEPDDEDSTKPWYAKAYRLKSKIDYKGHSEGYTARLETLVQAKKWVEEQLQNQK